MTTNMSFPLGKFSGFQLKRYVLLLGSKLIYFTGYEKLYE